MCPQASERSPLLETDHAGMGREADADADADADGNSRIQRRASRRSRTREAAIFAWALVATAAVIVLAVWTQHKQQTSGGAGGHDGPRAAGKRNLVFMVSDGMGPASLSLTRSYRQH
ncbi:hypothetical protein E4U41_006069, partial [Claviceps citrina]